MFASNVASKVTRSIGWVDARADDLLPCLQRVAETMPPRPSHLLWLPWGRRDDRPDMAFSLEDDIYIAAYGGWTHEDDDVRWHYSLASVQLKVAY